MQYKTNCWKIFENLQMISVRYHLTILPIRTVEILFDAGRRSLRRASQ